MSDQPWKPSLATTEIRRLGSSPKLHLAYSTHAKDQIADRDLIMGDLRFLLKNGFVYDDPSPATKLGFFRYLIQCETPNSNGRAVRAVVIPDEKRVHIKVITVMWVDE